MPPAFLHAVLTASGVVVLVIVYLIVAAVSIYVQFFRSNMDSLLIIRCCRGRLRNHILRLRCSRRGCSNSDDGTARRNRDRRWGDGLRGCRSNCKKIVSSPPFHIIIHPSLNTETYYTL
jgi:hypothetical protein